MLSWLSDIANAITGAINDVKNWILKIIQAVYSFIDSTITGLEHDFTTAWNALNSFINQVSLYAVDVWNTFTLFVRVTWAEFTQWAIDSFNDVRLAINTALTWTAQQLTRIEAEALQLITDWKNWIVTNLIDPLTNAVGNIISWIEQWGTYVVNMLTHPDVLATWLGKYLWQSYLDLLKRYSAPIAKWLLRTMAGLAGEFVDVLESIISALL